MINWFWLIVALVVGFVVGWFVHRPSSAAPAARSAAPSGAAVQDGSDRIRALEAELAECRSNSALGFAAQPAEPVLDLAEGARALGHAVKLNDLKVVEGIGPKIEQLILAEGITTWRALATSEVSVLDQLLTDAGPRYRMHDPSSWPRQAKLLADGHWTAFSNLIAELNRGR